MSNHGLPEDVLINILSRLPAKCVLRSQCVCTFWYALIQTPIFKAEHCLRNTSREDGQILVLNGRRRGKIFNDIALSVLVDDYIHDVFRHTDFPFKFSRHPSFMSVCNGIVFILFQRERRIIFWNPAIREVRVLENLTLDCVKSTTWRENSGRNFGFGFDPKTKDYKVVGLLSRWTNDYKTVHRFPPKAQVYSLSHDMWREIEPSGPSHDGHLTEGAYADRMFHWRVYGSRDLVLSFDMVNEVFHWISFPDTSEERWVKLSTLNERLALIFYPKHSSVGALDVWVRNGDHVGGSWIKHYSLDGYLADDSPTLLWKNGLFLLNYCLWKLTFLDFCDRIGDERQIRFAGVRYGLKMFIYKASLFSVKPLSAALSG